LGHKDGEIEEDVNHRIRVEWMRWNGASRVLCKLKIPIKLNKKYYKIAIQPAMLYGINF